MNKLLLLALVCAALPAAQAQTGRIAHLSHGGSVATMAAAGRADNFGYPITKVIQEIERTSDSTVVLRGYWTHGSKDDHRPMSQTMLLADRMKHPPANGWMQVGGNIIDVVESPEELRKRHPDAVFIGLDKFERRKPAPKKPSGRVPSFRRRPFQYSYWRGLATVAALGAVGWGLGRKRAT